MPSHQVRASINNLKLEGSQAEAHKGSDKVRVDNRNLLYPLAMNLRPDELVLHKFSRVSELTT